MRVKDILDSFREYNVPPLTPWFLHDNNNIVGSIHYWEYVCNMREHYLLGYAWSNIRGGVDYQLSTINDFRQIVELNDIPNTIDVKVKVPYLEYNQCLTNVSFNKRIGLFKSAVKWKE